MMFFLKNNRWNLLFLVLLGLCILFFLSKNENSEVQVTEVVSDFVVYERNLLVDSKSIDNSVLSSRETSSSPESEIITDSIEEGLKVIDALSSKHTQKDSRRSEERKVRQERYKALTHAASNKNWERFIELSESVMAQSEHSKHSTLVAAIRDKAPKSVFESLLARGAMFQSHHLMRAVMLDDLSFLQMLVSLGLDIHMTGRNGGNAINTLASSLASRKNFNYLLANNVEIRSESNGISPLSKALNRALINKEGVYYAYMLIQYGVKVSDKDLALVKRVKEENRASYDLIQRNIPSLTRS